MLEYSARLNEKLIKHAVPDITEKEIDQIIYTNNWCNPSHYPNFWDIVEKNNPNLLKQNIDQIFVNVVERALSAENPFAVTVRTLLSYLGAEEEEDILDEIEIHTRACEYMIQEIRDPNEVSASG